MGAAETVVAYILVFAGTFVVVKSIDDGLCGGHAAPDGGINVGEFGAGGESVFKRFLRAVCAGSGPYLACCI